MRHTWPQSLLSLLRIRSSLTQAEAQQLWNDVAQQPLLHELMVAEGAAIWLYRRLHDHGVTLDDPIGTQLRKAAHEHLMLGIRVDSEAVATYRILKQAQIDVVLIKGAARRAATSLYPYANARPSSDVDLLVRDTQAQDAWNVLCANGYEPVPNASPEDHFHLHGLWSASRVGVELHMATSPWLQPDECWRRANEGADVVSFSGENFVIANATELLWHALQHAFVDGSGGFTLRKFLDGAAILAAERPIDWQVVQNRIERGEVRNIETNVSYAPRYQYRWIAACARLAGVTVPAELLRYGEMEVARLLAWRTYVRSVAKSRAWRERLLEEGTRAELGMQLTPSVAGDGFTPRIRRRGATSAARVLYLLLRVGLG